MHSATEKQYKLDAFIKQWRTKATLTKETFFEIRYHCVNKWNWAEGWDFIEFGRAPKPAVTAPLMGPPFSWPSHSRVPRHPFPSVSFAATIPSDVARYGVTRGHWAASLPANHVRPIVRYSPPWPGWLSFVRYHLASRVTGRKWHRRRTRGRACGGGGEEEVVCGAAPGNQTEVIVERHSCRPNVFFPCRLINFWNFRYGLAIVCGNFWDMQPTLDFVNLWNFRYGLAIVCGNF